ncbi:hypothetical protein [Rathayibacter toxicus]|uniref:hypothetical protein n=1 Tax=Rathayibacter toxicus TaxID=145458 RepID=UPI000A5653FF|nr:hypothetical protein [Rathayibacter toxicus]QOD07558.1 hypothetical protein AYW78_06525 [Rathayibacter toxicus]
MALFAVATQSDNVRRMFLGAALFVQHKNQGGNDDQDDRHHGDVAHDQAEFSLG